MERLILGANPLTGVDHLSSDRARFTLRGMSDSRALDVVRAAIKGGATGFTFSPGSRVMGLLKALQESGETTKVRLYPLLPALEKYWPIFQSRGTYGLISSVLDDLSWSAKARALWKGGIAAFTSNPNAAIDLYVRLELEKIRSASPKTWTIDGVFLGETFTDTILSLRAYGLIGAFCESVEAVRGARAGLQTRNLAMLLASRTEWQVGRLPLIMAPFNPVGFQMTPDREACEMAAERAGTEFVAISVLAAGLVSLQGAADYLSKRTYISSVAVGTSSPQHAMETFETLRSVLGGPDGRAR